MPTSSQNEPPLPEEVRAELRARGHPTEGEVALRQALEAYLPAYSLFRLPPAAVKRWKARYRLLTGTTYFDGQTPAEVYAHALLAHTSEPASGEE